jgi:hypothetical protein
MTNELEILSTIAGEFETPISLNFDSDLDESEIFDSYSKKNENK